jgi:hypothetical protein
MPCILYSPIQQSLVSNDFNHVRTLQQYIRQYIFFIWANHSNIVLSLFFIFLNIFNSKQQTEISLCWQNEVQFYRRMNISADVSKFKLSPLLCLNIECARENCTSQYRPWTGSIIWIILLCVHSRLIESFNKTINMF